MAENRTERITIKVTPTMYSRLEALATELGQTPATLASVYLGEIVRTKEIQRETNQAVVERLGAAVQEQLSPFMQALEHQVLECEKQSQEND